MNILTALDQGTQMTNHQLGRLESVELRSQWNHEASHFTPWLTQEENLALLADQIGLELELVAIESAVGTFRADIVCRDTVSGEMVLIENQIETTDHSHLGQLLTYAAGFDAVTIVWIARRFTDEHRAALDWLNEKTSEKISLFGLEIELWKIGDSLPAPRFNIVSKPNGWVKRSAVDRRSGSEKLTETQELQLEYWQEFQLLVSENGRVIKARKALPLRWAAFAIGRTDVSLEATIKMRERVLSVSLALTGDDAKQIYQQLERQQAEIERMIGEPLTWWPLPDKKACYVSLYRANSSVEERGTWAEQHEWLLSKLELFHRTFAQRIKTISAVNNTDANSPGAWSA